LRVYHCDLIVKQYMLKSSAAPIIVCFLLLYDDCTIDPTRFKALMSAQEKYALWELMFTPLSRDRLGSHLLIVPPLSVQELPTLFPTLAPPSSLSHNGSILHTRQ
jgi:hypothetical protein